MRRACAIAGSVTAIALACAAPAARADAPVPTVVTGRATSVTQTSARLNGTVNPNGGPARYLFVFSGSDRISHDAGAGTAPVPVSTLVTGLLPGSTYTFQLSALNGDGFRTDGRTVTFTTAKPRCRVPRLRGLTVLDASIRLSRAHCGLGRVRYRDRGSGLRRILNRFRARVISQSLPAGRRVPGDTRVNLVLGS